MDKVTQINVEGRDYGFVAGQAVKGICSSAASDYIKIVTLPEGADLVEGMLVDIRFANGNTAGFLNTQTIYSSDGLVYYWDSQLTEAVTIPPEGCYSITPVSGQRYAYKAWPILSVGGYAKPLCDIKGYARGGVLWNSGDSVVVITLDDKYLALNTIAAVIKQGLNIPVTSDGLYNWPETSITPNSVRPPTGGAVLTAISNAINSAIPGAVAEAVSASFERNHPKGSTYDQYPGQKSPMDLWGDFSTWEVLDYGGAFFRTGGGSADLFEKTLTINSVSGTTLSFSSAHGLVVGQIVYDPVNNESRKVASVPNTTSATVDSAFTGSVTKIMVAQFQATAKNGLKLNSKADMTGTANTTEGHSHSYTRYRQQMPQSGSDTNCWNGTVSVATSSAVDKIYLGSNDTETRPDNFTKVVWVRTA